MTSAMTRLLYLEDLDAAYRKEFSATITKRGEDYVLLDQTLFYPTGGGQEHDTGVLKWEGGQSRVLNVEKKGVVKHILETMPPEGVTHVHGVIDWPRRHNLMRMHTAQHLISGLVYDHYGSARTVGNQLHPDRSRLDFRPFKVAHEELVDLEARINKVLSQDIPVRVVTESRASLEARLKPERSNLDLIPKSIPELRVVEIGAFDTCPCGGTHVKNTKEIGRVQFTDRQSKGAETTRVEYVLDPKD
jgi:misacylated tRNA(Ala) deacylase